MIVKNFYGIVICLSLLFFVSCRQTDGNPVKDKEAQRERFLAGQHLNSLLCARDLDNALLYLDTVQRKYPREPQFYFCEGWVHDMQNDSVKARLCFSKAVAIYDSLLAVKENFGDQINRALIIQILYGREAYDKCLDDMLRTAKEAVDTMAIENAYRHFNYNKEELFKPGSNRGQDDLQ